MRLIFVYNADSGMLNTAKDIGHKLFSPSTYNCLLCSLTHGTFRENPEWKEFCENLNCEMLFLHRDEFELQYEKQMEYPVVLRENGDLEVSITKKKMETFDSLQHLIDEVKMLAG